MAPRSRHVAVMISTARQEPRRAVLVQAVLRVDGLVHVAVPDQKADEEGDAGGGDVDAQHAVEAVDVGAEDARLFGEAVGHGAQRLDKGLGVVGERRGETLPLQLARHDVLERGAADPYAHGGAELPHEAVHARRGALLAVLAHGLGREVLRVEDGAVAQADDDQRDDPLPHRRVEVPQHRETRAHGAQDPADPDGVLVVVEPRDQGPGDDGARNQGEHDREQGEAGVGGAVPLYREEV